MKEQHQRSLSVVRDANIGNYPLGGYKKDLVFHEDILLS